MPLAKRFSLFFSFVLLLLALNGSAQSSVINKKVTLSFSGTNLGSALRKISSQEGVKFSYNPDLVPTGKRINFKCRNMPLGEALRQIINDPAITFHAIGNQLVLYRGNIPEPDPQQAKSVLAEKPAVKLVHDTVYRTRTDTVFIHTTDTITKTVNTVRVDTVRLTDTVIRYHTQKANKRFKNPFANSNMRQQKFSENNGFYTGAFIEALPGGPHYKAATSGDAAYTLLMKEASNPRKGDFSAGIIIGYDNYKLGVRSGIGITRLGERFDYTYNKVTGGFFRTDTLTRYYTLHGSDTAWFYITDSTWIPKETKEYRYKSTNSYHYIDIPLNVKYRLLQNDFAELYALGGVTGSFLAGHNALAIAAGDEQNAGWIEKAQLSPLVLSLQAGAGGVINLGGKVGVMGEISYRGLLSNQFKNMPVKKTFNMAGIRFGVFYKL